MDDLAVFQIIERQFALEREGGGLDRALDRWSLTHNAFLSLTRTDDLVAFCRDESQSYEARNPIALALCTLFQAGDETAKLMLVEMFMPALRTVLNNYRGNGVSQEDLETEILAGFLKRVGKVTPETQRVIGKLVGAARDAASKAVEAAIKADRTPPTVSLVDLPPSQEPATPGAADTATAPDEERLEMLLRAARAGVLTGFEAQLIALTRIGGRSLQEAAGELGSTAPPDALKVKRHRAEWVLAAWIRGEEPPARRNIRAERVTEEPSDPAC
jgi:hypothetical protein